MSEGIVHELQRAANDHTTPIADLLRLALTAASKLGLAGTSRWIRHELTGYADFTAIPPYRHLRGKLHAQHPIRGNWNPVSFGEDVALADALELRRMEKPIAYLDDLATGADGYIHSTVSDDIVEKLRPKTDQNYNILIAKSAVIACLDIVRTTVLEWALELERQGIHGENYSFTAYEKRAAVEAGPGATYINVSNSSNVNLNSAAQHGTATQSLAPPKAAEKKFGLLAAAQAMVDLWNRLPAGARAALIGFGSAVLGAAGTYLAAAQKWLRLP